MVASSLTALPKCAAEPFRFRESSEEFFFTDAFDFVRGRAPVELLRLKFWCGRGLVDSVGALLRGCVGTKPSPPLASILVNLCKPFPYDGTRPCGKRLWPTAWVLNSLCVDALCDVDGAVPEGEARATDCDEEDLSATEGRFPGDGES